MYKHLLLLFFFAGSISCTHHEKEPVDMVNPFIGTVGSGNVFFGASLPHGMVMLGPWVSYDSGGAAGTLRGFGHTHVSGMAGGGNGVAGEVLFLPVSYNTPTGTAGYRFLHRNESAAPGYYKIIPDSAGLTIELTATLRAGLMKITYPAGTPPALLIKRIRGLLTPAGNHLAGHSGNVYFYSRFSQPVSHVRVHDGDSLLSPGTHYHGEHLQALLTFAGTGTHTLYVATGISWVDTAGARNNLEAELTGPLTPALFDSVVAAARHAWNRELDRIQVTGGTAAQRTIFYTALYHSLMHPNIFMDADRRYRGSNGTIYIAKDFDNYTNFSLWDTFRALHPLYTLLDRARTAQFIRTFLARYDHTGRMLIMEFNGTEGEQPPMIAYHSLSVLADAWVKGIRDYDTVKAYTAMKELADDLHRKGKQLYLDYGFIPCDLKGQSVSRTLEYSYDDWCVTRLAKDFNDTAALVRYGQRGAFWQNLFDTTLHFMRGRKRNFAFTQPFDPMETVNHYTEANAWQYSTFVPQDLYGLIARMGGDSAFIAWLDTCFTKESDPAKINVRDVTGLIGQYAHGNEPSHHMAYLYDYAGAPWKTQARVRQILTTLYHDTQDGIDGNEDCGQMSAWYVLSALGLYAVTPGMPYFVMGSPLFDKMTLRLENGKRFTIRARRNGAGRMYIRSARLNGRPWNKAYLPYHEIMKGGELVLEMDAVPHRSWAAASAGHPPAAGHPFHWASSPTPHFEDIYFAGPMPVTITADSGTTIRYTLDGSPPDEQAPICKKPLLIRHSCTLRLRGYTPGQLPSWPRRVHFRKIDMLPAVTPGNVLRQGILYHFIDRPVENAASITEYPVTESGTTATFNVDIVDDQRPFGEWFEGYLKVPATGIYTFSVEANDGAILYLNGKEIVNNDGGHRAQKLDMKTGLEKGWHPILVKYFQQGLAKELKVYWQGPGMQQEEEIPEEALFWKDDR
jgi:predicted alpha-1,2-mannosidase